MNTFVKRWRRLKGQDSGSALVLALLVVLVTSLLLTAVLDFTGTGLTLAPKLRNDRNNANYLQGAVDGAIESIRGSSTDGRTNTGIQCPTYSPPVPAGELGVDGHVYEVSCSPLPVGTGSPGADQPDFAIQALGQAPEGIRQSGGNDQLTINGGIYSHGVVTVNAGNGNTKNKMVVYGSVLADGACDQARITTTDADTKPDCDRNTTPADGTFGGDPKYGASIVDDAQLLLLAHAGTPAEGADPVPTCAGGNGGPVTFYPGYYSERPDVLVARLASNCTGSRWLFRPGRYYFDYPDVWDLGSPRAVTVFAGDVAAGATLGLGCDPNQDQVQDVDGVQFVFGGSSRMSVTGAGGVEICGPRPGQNMGSTQRISMYGIDNGVDDPGTGSSPLAASSAPTSSGNYPFLLPEKAQVIDGTSTTALVIPKNKQAQLQYAGFDPLPKGSRVTALRIKVVHALLGGVTAKVAVTTPSHPTAGNAQTFDLPATCTTAVPCFVDVPLAHVADAPAWRDVNNLAMTYTAYGPTGNAVAGTAAVDGVSLEVDYEVPTLRKLDCGTPNCTFFNSTVNLNVFVSGTVYTPSASWAVQVQNDSGTIFNRGVVVRNIDISVSASSKQETAPFQLPLGTPFGRRVLFRGYVDQQESLRACVLYDDRDGLPGYGATVNHWALLRSPTTQNPTCQ